MCVVCLRFFRNAVMAVALSILSCSIAASLLSLSLSILLRRSEISHMVVGCVRLLLFLTIGLGTLDLVHIFGFGVSREPYKSLFRLSIRPQSLILKPVIG